MFCPQDPTGVHSWKYKCPESQNHGQHYFWSLLQVDRQLHTSSMEQALLFLSLSPLPAKKNPHKNKNLQDPHTNLERPMFRYHPSSCTAASHPLHNSLQGRQDNLQISTRSAIAFSQFLDSSTGHLAGWGCSREGNKKKKPSFWLLMVRNFDASSMFSIKVMARKIILCEIHMVSFYISICSLG